MSAPLTVEANRVTAALIESFLGASRAVTSARRVVEARQRELEDTVRDLAGRLLPEDARSGEVFCMWVGNVGPDSKEALLRVSKERTTLGAEFKVRLDSLTATASAPDRNAEDNHKPSEDEEACRD